MPSSPSIHSSVPFPPHPLVTMWMSTQAQPESRGRHDSTPLSGSHQRFPYLRKKGCPYVRRKWGEMCNFSFGWRVLSVLPLAPLTPPSASLQSSRDPTFRSVHLLGEVPEKWGGGQRAGTGETGRVLSCLGVKRE